MKFSTNLQRNNIKENDVKIIFWVSGGGKDFKRGGGRNIGDLVS